jgi:cation diffusion facilitator CzcD-associated flavoprotein CzcO
MIFRGLVAYRELSQTDAFTTIRLFERDDVPGGNWHYSEEIPDDAPIPNQPPQLGDYIPDVPVNLTAYGGRYEEIYEEGHEQWADRRRRHRAPKPLWESLTSNAPSVSFIYLV